MAILILCLKDLRHPQRGSKWLSGGSPGPWNHVFLSPSTGHQSNSLLRKW